MTGAKQHPEQSRAVESPRQVILCDEPLFTELPGAEYAGLTFPRFQHLLSPGRGDVFALGAFCGDVPVALALFSQSSSKFEHATLLSIMVERRFRGKGLAGTLLARAEAQMFARGCTFLGASYSSRLPRLPEFERLLTRAGWGKPKVTEIRAAGYAADGVAEMMRMELSARPFLPSDAVIDLWGTVTGAERSQVDALVAEIQFNPFLAPALWERNACLELSLVLRHNGKIAGWVFGERDSDEFCHYNCGYVVPELRRRGALIALIREACRRQAGMFGPKSVAQLSTTPETPGMPRFIRERLAPCSLWCDEMRRAEKDLGTFDETLRSEPGAAQVITRGLP